LHTSRLEGPKGIAVVTVRVPAQLVHPASRPDACTATVWVPGETGVKSATTGVESPGASGSETKVGASTDIATTIDAQFAGEAVNWSCATLLETIEVVNAGSHTPSVVEAQVMEMG
jgi:hypothetical protein